jgi:chaperonin GroES
VTWHSLAESAKVTDTLYDKSKLKLNLEESRMNIRPLGDRILVEPIEQEESTNSGILLPETAKEKPQQGSVLAVGAGRRDDDGERIPMDVEVGNKVLFAKYAGTEIKMDGKKMLIMKETDILGIIE